MKLFSILLVLWVFWTTLVITGVDSKLVRKNKVLPLQKRLHGGIPKFPLIGTFRDPYMGGFYYTMIQLGSPPTKFHVQIDTGSNDLWVNCNPCPDCPRKSNLGFKPNLFIPEKSSTARPLDCFDSVCSLMDGQCTNETSLCQFSREYEGGRGAFGYYISDLMEMDVVMPGDSNLVKNTSVRVLFGCSTHLAGGFTQENQSIDGILGLGKVHPSPVLQVEAQLMIPPIFSHCLGGDGHGMLVFGEFDYDAAVSVVYTPLLPTKERYYHLDLKSISVGGKLLKINTTVFNTSYVSGTFVDSGTSLAYLVAEAYDIFIDAINLAVANYAAPINFEGKLCYKMSISHIDRFPLVTFNFAGDASMSLNPKDYILTHRPIIDGVPALCMGLQKSTVDNFSILGDLVLKDKIIVYDTDSQRLGWTGYFNCSEGKVKTSGWGGVVKLSWIKRCSYWVMIVLLL